MPVSQVRGPREARLSSDAILPSYADWHIERPPAPGGTGKARNIGFTAVQPARRMDTEDSVSN